MKTLSLSLSTCSIYVFSALLSLSYANIEKVLRDGRWTEQDAAILVPGDIVSVKLGDIIPADARLLEGDPLKIDQVGLLLHLIFYQDFCFYSYVLTGDFYF